MSMVKILELLKEAIVAQKWPEVVAAYEQLSGDTTTFAKEPNVAKKATKKSRRPQQPAAVVKSSPESEVLINPIYKDSTESAPIKTSSTKIATPNTYKLITGAEDKKLQQACLECAQDKDYRNPAPKIIKICTECKDEFEVSKAGGGAVLDKESKIVRCGKCQKNRS